MQLSGSRSDCSRLKEFTEQIILGELIGILIEESTDLEVVRRLNLAGTFLCHHAVQNGEIDLYVEYTGTAYTGILELPPVSNAQKVYSTVREEYSNRFDLHWTEPLGFNNTFAIMVRGEDARELNLQTISDSIQYARDWQAGFGYEFLHRADGFIGLSRTYGLTFSKPPREMDLGLMYRALAQGEIDFVAGNSTEGLVSVLDLVILEDDLHYFPPYEAAPVVNGKSLKRFPQLRNLLRKLDGLISDQEMRTLNYEVDAKKRNVRQVAFEFLEKKDCCQDRVMGNSLD